MFLYCLFIQNSMPGDDIHNAHDDCAICKAWSKSHAIRPGHQKISKNVLRF